MHFIDKIYSIDQVIFSEKPKEKMCEGGRISFSFVKGVVI